MTGDWYYAVENESLLFVAEIATRSHREILHVNNISKLSVNAILGIIKPMGLNFGFIIPGFENIEALWGDEEKAERARLRDSLIKAEQMRCDAGVAPGEPLLKTPPRESTSDAYREAAQIVDRIAAVAKRSLLPDFNRELDALIARYPEVNGPNG